MLGVLEREVSVEVTIPSSGERYWVIFRRFGPSRTIRGPWRGRTVML